MNGKKYCNLHVDYDTNPPPRRGGCGGGQKTKSNNAFTIQNHSRPATVVAAVQKKSNSKSFDRMQDKTSTSSVIASTSDICGSSDSKSESQPKTKNDVSIQVNNTRGTTTSPLTINPMPNYALLNTLSPERWSNKQVLIGTGPLVNHTGRVMKWGNGWVTISTNTGGIRNDPNSSEILHNRRAFELFLLPPGGECGSRGVSVKSSNNVSKGIVEENSPLLVTLVRSKKESVSDNCTSGTINDKKEKSNEASASNNIKRSQDETTDIDNLSKQYSSIKDDFTKEGTKNLNLNEESSSPTSEMEVNHDNIVAETKDETTGSIETNKNNDVSNTVFKKEYHLTTTPNNDYPNITSRITTSELEIQSMNHISDVSEVSNNKREVTTDDNEQQSLSMKGDDNEQDLLNVNDPPRDVKAHKGKKLTLMEELILAQTGRVVKNVDLVLCSGGGRMIKRPMKYEDKTLMKRKRTKHHSDGTQDD